MAQEEKNRVLIIERANIELKRIINNAMLLGIDKNVVKIDAEKVINKAIEELREMDKKDKKFLREVESALRMNFRNWYNKMIFTLQRLAKKDNIGIVRQTLEKMNTPVKTKFKEVKTGAFTIAEITPNTIGASQEEIENLRDFMTVYDEGAAGFYTDYVKEVKNNILNVEHEIADGRLTATDSLGRVKSIRNMAEIKTRYELIQGDMERLEKKGVKYVTATAHANCSERCSWWQGKTFLIDIDIASRQMYGYDKAKAKRMCKPLPQSKWIDGRETYSLKDAIECGFLSYNCQHKVVEYFKGIQPPQYTAAETDKKRDVSQKQRQIENEIYKLKQRLEMSSSDTEKKKIRKKIRALTQYYKEFCSKNNAPTYLWRTQIS